MGGAGMGPYVEGHVLSWLIFIPGGTALFLLAVSVALRIFFGASGLPGVVWRAIGLGGSGLALLVAGVGVLGQFDPEGIGHQMVERAPWLPGYGIHYFVGVDGISLFLVLLTALVVPLVLLASWNQVERDLASFVLFVLLLETGLLGALLSLNLLQFYAFAELSFVPLWLIVGVFGGAGRIRASTRLILYSAAGSVVSLVALLIVYQLGFEQTGVWTLDWIGQASSGTPGLIDVRIPIAGEDVAVWRTQPWLFAAFALSFAIRIPMLPLHTWMPEAHVEAPTAGSVLLSLVMLEVGAYGMMRFALTLFPNAAADAVPLLFALAVLGILHGALVAMVQRDLKRLVAYACLAQLSLAMLGVFSLSLHGLIGGVVQLVSFGLTSSALFLLVGVIEERRKTRDVSELGGLAKPMPVFAAILGVTVMASAGLPVLSGFVGQLLILLGSFAVDARAALGAGVGLVLLAAALLWMFQRVALGPVEKAENRGLIDLDWRERSIFLALLVPILWIGVHPNPVLRRIEPSVLELMKQIDERRDLAPILPPHDAEPSDLASPIETSDGDGV